MKYKNKLLDDLPMKEIKKGTMKVKIRSVLPEIIYKSVDEKLIHPIKYLRLCNKYSQKDFAKFLEIAQGTLSKIENDRLSPDIRTLNILRISYGVDLNKLILDLNVRNTKGYES